MEVLQDGILMWSFCLVLCEWMAERLTSLDVKYVGAKPFRHLYTIVTSRKRRRSSTGSHPRSLRTGDI